MKELTEKQRRVLDFIKAFHAENAMMPTVREIAIHFKLSIGSIQQHLRGLLAKGAFKCPNSQKNGNRVFC